MNKKIDNDKIEIIALTVMAILIVIVGIFCRNMVTEIDIKLLEIISNKFIYKVVFIIMNGISIICQPIPMIIITIIFAVICESKRIIVVSFTCTGISAMFNLLVKIIFRRQRPLEYMLIDEAGYSFPSAHAMVSITFYGILFYLTMKYVDKKWMRYILNTILSILIILTPISRIYLGVHHLSDVIVGSFLGYVILRISIYILNKYKLFKKNNNIECKK